MHSLTPLEKKKKQPKNQKHQPVCFLLHYPPWQPRLWSSKQLHHANGRSEEKTFKRPTFRSQAKCLWKSISHSILQAHRTAATSLLTATDKAASCCTLSKANSNNGRRARRWLLGTLCALELTRSVCSSSHSPCCICSGSREGPPCGLVSGQPETFRAKPKNSKYASWLYSLSFFSFFF